MCSCPEFTAYRSGIFNSECCGAQDISTHVLIVGYGNDGKGTEFWTVKMPWGVGWGESGYARVKLMSEDDNSNTSVATGGYNQILRWGVTAPVFHP
jgi:hypothetical protein